MSTPPSSESFTPSPYTKARRDDRARYDRQTVYDIIDAAPMCNVGFVHHNRPVVIPTLHVRIDDHVFIHGAHPTRLLRDLRGSTVCVTTTLLDGWVLARSAFHHSANYRSALVYGTARPVDDVAARHTVLDALMEKIAPGRSSCLRPTTEKEIRATAVLAIPIEEASAKVRTGPPVDEDDDMDLPIWAGVLPFRIGFEAPIPAPDLHSDATVPEHLGFFFA